MKSKDQAMVKEHNQKVIVDILRREGSLPRADMGKIAEMTPPTVSKNVDRLMESEILRVAGHGSSMGGRTAELYDINYGNFYIIACDFSWRIVTCSIGNLKGTVLNSLSYKVPNKMKSSEALALVYSKIELLTSGFDKEKIRLISISSPGVSDKNGLISYAPADEWFIGVPLITEFRNRYNIPVIISNDVNSAAYLEYFKGYGTSYSHMLYIRIDKGVGSGIISDNILYTGRSGRAGEIGFSYITSPEGIDTTLENYISTPMIIARIIQAIESGERSQISGFTSGNMKQVDLSVIKKAIDSGDSLSTKIVGNVISVIAKVISNLAVSLDSDLFVIGGEIEKLGGYFIDNLRLELKRISVFDVQVVYPFFKENPGLNGALIYGIDYAFDNFYDILVVNRKNYI